MNGKVIAILVVAVMLVGKFFFSGPLPAIKVPAEILAPLGGGLNLTNTLLATWLTIIIAFLLFRSVTGNMKMVPGRLQGMLEFIVDYLYTFVDGIGGAKYARSFFPFIATIFFFVLFNAWLSLLPGFGTIGLVESAHGEGGVTFQQAGPVAVILPSIMAQPAPSSHPAEGEHAAPSEHGAVVGELVPFLRGANTDLNTPAALAVLSFIFVEMWGIRVLGLGYFKKFFNFSNLLHGNIMTGFIDVFVGLLELVSELVRLVSFTFRLFGNMFAGEVLLAVVVFLVPWVLIEAFYFLELLVGLIQAFVFAALTLVFVSMAVTSHGEGHAEVEHGGSAAEH